MKQSVCGVTPSHQHSRGEKKLLEEPKRWYDTLNWNRELIFRNKKHSIKKKRMFIIEWRKKNGYEIMDGMRAVDGETLLLLFLLLLFIMCVSLINTQYSTVMSWTKKNINK